jgi:hypothetical protein
MSGKLINIIEKFDAFAVHGYVRARRARGQERQGEPGRVRGELRAAGMHWGAVRSRSDQGGPEPGGQEEPSHKGQLGLSESQQSQGFPRSSKGS